MKDIMNDVLRKLANKYMGVTEVGEQKVLVCQTSNETNTIVERDNNLPVDNSGLIKRTISRLSHRELENQKNLEDILGLADDNLKNMEESKDEGKVEIDESWFNHFSGYAMNVSNEEMKHVWAKLLSGEIKRPDTYSLRTLNILSMLSKKEAELFEKLSQFVFKQDTSFIYDDQEALRKLGVHYVDLARLTEVGVLQSGDFVTKHFASLPDVDSQNVILYGEYVVIMTIPKGSNAVEVPVVLLTQSGMELMRLIEPVANVEYLKEFAKKVRMKNPKVIIQYAEIISTSGETVKYKLPVKDL